MIYIKVNKKEYILKILEKLESSRNLASGLKILVLYWNLEDTMLDMLIKAIKSAVSSAKNVKEKNKLNNSLKALEKIKQLEASHSVENGEQELDNLLNYI